MAAKFVALQQRVRETDHETIKAFFDRASGLGLEFTYLEPYGPITVGSAKLLRFKTDCPDLELLLPFFQEEERSFVFPHTTGYSIHTQTTEGVVPVSVMQAVKFKGYQRRYRGVGVKFWERQFSI